ncbi:keratin, type I cytoskeletal 13-like [Halichoeres trimaculatus]|uniref:keratin, type I cytoskeletal 13-like n=1 Tax=Halichoeres trimaculatus TaxID=147232 RepID=UPI003D9E2C39
MFYSKSITTCPVLKQSRSYSSRAAPRTAKRVSDLSFRQAPCISSSQVRTISSGFGGGMGMGGHARLDLSSVLNQNTIYLTEKATMQELNERLASYIEKVRALEAANATLEKQIEEFYEKKGQVAERDYSTYWAIISDLKDKIAAATIGNAHHLLQSDNSKLAADDFKTKLEHELMMRQSVEADISSLRRLLDQSTLTKASLKMQIEGLQDELAYLKKDHTEDLAELRSQPTGPVNVEVDAAPQKDLNKVLEEIRAKYASITAKHRCDQDAWFREKSAALSKVVAVSTKTIQMSETDIGDRRRTLQSLEIELQSKHIMKAGLERTVAETEARYSTTLAGFQKTVDVHQSKLASLRAIIEQQGQDYKILLNIKTRLEQEIATYRSLLETEDSR